MSIDAAFYYEAVHTTAITAVIGARLYPAGGTPTSATLPFAVYQKISNEHHRWQGGRSNLACPRIQVDCYGALQKDASDLAELFRLTFDSFIGDMGDPADSTAVRLMILEDDREFYEPPSDGSQKGAWRVSMDFLIWHVEA